MKFGGEQMLRPTGPSQGQLEVVYIEQLVAPDHLLRKVQKAVDFTFIRKKMEPLYSADNGRPAVDPVVLFKMLFIGYLFGVRSERRLVEEIRHNVAYRWFLGLGLTHDIPTAAAIWQNRRRRWKDTTLCQEIFDEIVRQCIHHGLVSGEVLYTDATTVKANANKKKYLIQQVPASTKAYMESLEQAVNEDRAAHGKKALTGPKEVKLETREIKVSTTDPDAGYRRNQDGSECFAYRSTQTVDARHNIIVDVCVKPGNVVDAEPYVERIQRIREVHSISPLAVALDSGYFTAYIAHWLREQGIFAVIGHRRFQSVKGMLPKAKFTYDAAADCYHCPGNSQLKYRNTDRDGYRLYQSDPTVCRSCLLLPYCTRSKTYKKVITQHIWDEREWLRENRLTPYGKEVYRRRKETVERCFADAKELHGLRYARMRGLPRVREQCLLTAAAQNIKKLALIQDRRSRRASAA